MTGFLAMNFCHFFCQKTALLW